MSGGELGQFVLYAMIVGIAAGGLSEIWGEIQRAAGAMERLTELLAMQPMIVAPEDPVPLPTPCRGEVTFEDVSFSYPSRPDERAVEGFSLTVHPG